MPSSISVARATATLPRHWSKPLSSGQALQMDPRISKRQEGANKTRLILQNYLKRGIEPPPEVLDSLDPTNVSYDGTLSSKGSSESLRIISTASDERKRLLKKQTRRQNILPSFFEPLGSKPDRPVSNLSGSPVALTAAALTAHDHPAVAFLAAPSRVIRRAISFAGPTPPPPMIRIIKPEPECLDDHSNPSSRDPFYYDKVLEGLNADRPPTPPRRQRRRTNSKQPEHRQRRSAEAGSPGIEPDAVTAWFADQYLASS